MNNYALEFWNSQVLELNLFSLKSKQVALKNLKKNIQTHTSKTNKWKKEVT